MKAKFSFKEFFILLVVTAMSVVANLPEDFGTDWFNRKMLVGVLAAIVVIAMFRYLKAMLLIIITVLAVGANLPHTLAENIGVDQVTLLVVLGLIIAITLANRLFRMVPTYAEPPEDTNRETISHMDDTDARQLLMEAIAHGKTSIIRDLLDNNMELNFSMNGTTPLHLATEKGYPNIVQLLLENGADVLAQNEDGQTPLELALAIGKFVRTSEILYHATMPLLDESQKADLGT